jgi:large subunit ribosomal protein L15
MPLQRRLPKVGFSSRQTRFAAEVRLHELALVKADVVDAESLKKAGIVPKQAAKIKVIASGAIDKAVTVKGVGVTPGARAAIEAAGGKVE